jgi:phospholipid/cholesterol/gamma-HCH transport system permease protein
MTGSHPLPEAVADDKTATAQLQAGAPGGECLLKIGGDWRLSGPVPSWDRVLGGKTAAHVRVVPEDLGKWDTSLLLFLVHGRKWCTASKHDFHVETLPENLQTLLRQVENVDAPKPAIKAAIKSNRALAAIFAKKLAGKTMENISFLGECALGIVSLARHPRRFRWMDCVVEMQRCWSSSLPIVSLVSFLVGVILAFQAPR